MAELRRTTDYLRRGLDQAKALTRRRQQQAAAGAVEPYEPRNQLISKRTNESPLTRNRLTTN